jgi:hypothetical protein
LPGAIIGFPIPEPNTILRNDSVTQHPKQRLAWIDVGLNRLAVDVEDSHAVLLSKKGWREA